ncbi:uncharacterized protein LOC124076395 isoform X3 [Marmota monax]|uniref:uncharacterized protein LOC124076395 isoform X3 n=1 Tax=Marmota monax TaxID=9995 RepID=UPI001EB0A116|nr:uncharacterized protein LOC124076395 isoform X3 [Marmota monax]
MQKSRPFRRPRRQSSPYGCTAPSPDPIHWTPKRRNFWKQLRSCFMCCCLCLADGPPPIGTPESGRSSFRSTPDSPGEVHPGENITAYSLGDLEETLEPAFFYDCFSSASNISSSSTQQEMGQMLGSQVTVTGPEEEDQGHQVPALTENPEPMEEQAEGVLPGEPGGDPGAHVLSIILFGLKYLEFLHPTRDGPNVGKPGHCHRPRGGGPRTPGPSLDRKP